MRFWLSGPRIGWFRPGISLGHEDLHPRLPSWRRYELHHGLQEAALDDARSVNALLEKIAIDWLKEHGYLKWRSKLLHNIAVGCLTEANLDPQLALEEFWMRYAMPVASCVRLSMRPERQNNSRSNISNAWRAT